jgi:hypothetical protein
MRERGVCLIDVSMLLALDADELAMAARMIAARNRHGPRMLRSSSGRS